MLTCYIFSVTYDFMRQWLVNSFFHWLAYSWLVDFWFAYSWLMDYWLINSCLVEPWLLLLLDSWTVVLLPHGLFDCELSANALAAFLTQRRKYFWIHRSMIQSLMINFLSGFPRKVNGTRITGLQSTHCRSAVIKFFTKLTSSRMENRWVYFVCCI